MRASSEEEYEAWVEAIERARLDIAERDEALKDTGPLSEERRLARATSAPPRSPARRNRGGGGAEAAPASRCS